MKAMQESTQVLAIGLIFGFVVGQSQRRLAVHIGDVVREAEVSAGDGRSAAGPSEPFQGCMRSKQRYLQGVERTCKLEKRFKDKLNRGATRIN